MSDLFKKNAPRLSEDEERRLWERVRTVPDEVTAERATERQAAPARPWWRGLFAAPAFRFGAPALAVVVAATLFVIQQNPRAPVPQTVATRDADEAARMPEAVAPEAQQSAPRATAPVREEEAPEERRDRAFAKEPAPANEPTRSMRSAPVEVKKESAANLAEPPTKVTVIKGGKQDAGVSAPAPPPAAAPAPTRAKAGADRSLEQTRAQETLSMDERDAEGQAAPAPGATWGAVKQNYRIGDSPGPSFASIVAGTPASSAWIEVVPSLFDDGGVVVLAGTRTAGLGLLVDETAFVAGARPTPLVRDATSGRWGLAQWVYDRTPENLSPVVVNLSSPKGPALDGWPVKRRGSYRELSDEAAIAYFAAEGERTSAISASTTAGARFDRLLAETRALKARQQQNARLDSLIALLTSARANVR